MGWSYFDIFWNEGSLIGTSLFVGAGPDSFVVHGFTTAGERVNVGGLFVRACNYRVGMTSDRMMTSVVGVTNCRAYRALSRTSTMFLGAYSMESGTRRGVVGQLRTLRTFQHGNRQLVVKMLNYVTRHIQRSLVRRRRISIITNPSTCLTLPRLVTRIRLKRGTVGIRLSLARACGSVVPRQVYKTRVSNFMDVVEKYGGFYRCYVIPCAQKQRHDHSIRDVLGRIESLHRHNCGRIALLKRGIGSCGHRAPSNGAIAFPRLLHLITQRTRNVHIHFAASRPGSVDSRALRIVTRRSGIYGRVRLPIRDKDGHVLGLVGHGCAHR